MKIAAHFIHQTFYCMHYILLSGKMHSGKSTTIEAVFHRLKPAQVFEVDLKARALKKFIYNSKIDNGTYLVEIEGVWVVLVAGSPTEQKVTITHIIAICQGLVENIAIIVVAMRSRESLYGFDTITELRDLQELIPMVPVDHIAGEYETSSEWNERIDSICDAIRGHLRLMSAALV